ncbi:hypothetical protein ASPWEDRAFT_121490 [Aspergillus wentii DTO 134E9]|uniref:TPR domain protein n=1 Tax=Aspergillus wentii DTO 134E9 TaxID=1073089 RepID=A0A1L9R636_ASPWE|nr:uncharacterized protein ASPWEDRAFT_121490 [Aspergillus wentii DTO 134E9]OJJ30374.1 hypothetical protein ASPWEDRAFT_121490 [Aspergillus wentii DTO 134E9]
MMPITQQTSLSRTNEYYDLGSFGRKINTKNADAQAWFNRGLTWVYSFNHEEAAKCFEKATICDPSCGIAYWGLAFALGPNYNKPWELFDEKDLKTTVEQTYKAARTAQSLISNSTPLERGLINSIQARYEIEWKVSKKDWASRNRAYAEKMGSVYREFGHDLDVASLYADALMTLTPWKLWDLSTGKPASKARTLEVKQVLEKALKQEGGADHPGILHMYIHLVEMSPNPELGLNPADRLRDLVPDSGHMHHMPSHLDVLIGDYRRAIDANYKATLADDKFLAREGAYNFYTMYCLHNYHSLIYAAMLAGKVKTAIESVDRMEATLPEDLLLVQSPPMADWLEAFMSVRPHVMVRFGMWNEITQLALPKNQELYCVTTATIHYAKGVAWAASGNIKRAEQERTLFQAAFQRVPLTRMDYPNRCVKILSVGAAMLDGEIEYRRGNYEQAFSSLRESIKRDDGLIYSEPWGWMQPTRHAYAALMLEQGHVEEAANVYGADLGLNKMLSRSHWHPNNVWSLQGYHECLVRLGRTDEALLIEPQLTVALAVADVPIKSSCFCRRDEETRTDGARSCCPRTRTSYL